MRARKGAAPGHGGVELAYEELGRPDAPGLLILHGLYTRGSSWRPIAERFADRFRVVLPDQRGHGASGKPDGPYDRAAFAADAAALIERLGLGPAVVAGHSMGAITSWMLAHRRPDLVRAFAAVDMHPDTTRTPDQARTRAWVEGWPLPFPSWDAFFGYFGERVGAYLAPSFVRDESDGLVPVFRREHVLACREDWTAHSYEPELLAAARPALLVKGSLSDVTDASLDAVARVLPDCSVATVEDATHYVPAEQPERLADALEPFLARFA
ncbi:MULTISPECIES: alpha/beta fold hydrolase [Actinomadura]|uniref:Alpha/beta fold hydrolase n=1 Tax=Actinomadura yumaensis TaxID=111807 RepID=A0ABW2CV72_9ACTN|nr:alpha/beta hydrolase [Actinomadura sp. J1-007]